MQLGKRPVRRRVCVLKPVLPLGILFLRFRKASGELPDASSEVYGARAQAESAGLIRRSIRKNKIVRWGGEFQQISEDGFVSGGMGVCTPPREAEGRTRKKMDKEKEKKKEVGGDAREKRNEGAASRTPGKPTHSCRTG